MVVEAVDEDKARARCAELPMVRAGLLRCDYYPVKAFRAIKVAARPVVGAAVGTI